MGAGIGLLAAGPAGIVLGGVAGWLGDAVFSNDPGRGMFIATVAVSVPGKNSCWPQPARTKSEFGLGAAISAPKMAVAVLSMPIVATSVPGKL